MRRQRLLVSAIIVGVLIVAALVLSGCSQGKAPTSSEVAGGVTPSEEVGGGATPSEEVAGGVTSDETVAGGGIVPGEPAQINGVVTVAAQLKAGELFTYKPMDQNSVFWIVDVTVKNEYFEGEIWSNEYQWDIKAGDILYSAETFAEENRWLMRMGGEVEPWYPASGILIISPEMGVSPGESGETRLLFTVPGSLSVSDAELGYQYALGPYIWGSLSEGNRVFTYEWPE